MIPFWARAALTRQPHVSPRQAMPYILKLSESLRPRRLGGAHEHLPGLALDGSGGQPGHDVPLGQQVEDERGHQRQGDKG